MAGFLYEFEWDPAKAIANFGKHGVSFEKAAEIFRDPLALTIPDKEHSVVEPRWIPLGRDVRGQCLLVVHTHQELDGTSSVIRIISARRPTRSEMHSYEEWQ